LSLIGRILGSLKFWMSRGGSQCGLSAALLISDASARDWCNGSRAMIEDADASAGERFGHGIVVVFILEVDVVDGSAWKNEASAMRWRAMANSLSRLGGDRAGGQCVGRGENPKMARRFVFGLQQRAKIIDSTRTPAGRHPSWGPSGRSDL